VCASHCAQLLHTILHRTDLIVFPITLQTITTSPMMSIWGKWVGPQSGTFFGTRCINRNCQFCYMNTCMLSARCHRQNIYRSSTTTYTIYWKTFFLYLVVLFFERADLVSYVVVLNGITATGVNSKTEWGARPPIYCLVIPQGNLQYLDFVLFRTVNKNRNDRFVLNNASKTFGSHVTQHHLWQCTGNMSTMLLMH